jgi:hypothetical protein
MIARSSAFVERSTMSRSTQLRRRPTRRGYGALLACIGVMALAVPASAHTPPSSPPAVCKAFTLQGNKTVSGKIFAPGQHCDAVLGPACASASLRLERDGHGPWLDARCDHRSARLEPLVPEPCHLHRLARWDVQLPRRRHRESRCLQRLRAPDPHELLVHGGRVGVSATACARRLAALESAAWRRASSCL